MGARTLRISLSAYLAGLAVLALALPVLVLLEKSAIAASVLEPSGSLAVHDLVQGGHSALYAFVTEWLAAFIGFAVPAALLGLGQHYILSRLDRADYKSCALVCALTAPLAFLLMGVLVMIGIFHQGTESPLLFMAGLLVGMVLLIAWLGPFGALQGLVYRAIAGLKEPGRLFDSGDSWRI